MRKGLIEMETMTYIRGRSIPGQFILCDEAQNLSPGHDQDPHHPGGKDTKIVFTGDPEQIDHPYLDAAGNGLTYLVEKLKGEEDIRPRHHDQGGTFPGGGNQRQAALGLLIQRFSAAKSKKFFAAFAALREALWFGRF
jgi:hypothetical protein